MPAFSATLLNEYLWFTGNIRLYSAHGGRYAYIHVFSLSVSSHRWQRFDAEVTVSKKVARAITDIVARSPHPAFRKRCHRLIKVLLGVVNDVPTLTFL